MREMRAIDFVSRLIEEQRVDEQRYKRLLMHMIDGSDDLYGLGYSSKLNADWDYLGHLRGLGHAAADRWLEAHFDDIGARTSVDIAETFL
jgi:NTE family protein